MEKKYNWIYFDTAKNGVICSVCIEAVDKKLPLPINHNYVSSKSAFVDKGFRTWSNANIAFTKHTNGELHKSAVELLLESNRALGKIFTSIQFLVRQGLALRGHDDQKSNLQQLLFVRCADLPELKSWMERENFKWLHHTITDEIITMMADEVRKKAREDLKLAEKYSIMVDETSDI